MANEWTAIRHCASLQEAEFLKSLLESEGIDAAIPDEHALGINPGLTNALGGVRLIVRVEDEARAAELLASCEPAPSETE